MRLWHRKHGNDPSQDAGSSALKHEAPRFGGLKKFLGNKDERPRSDAKAAAPASGGSNSRTLDARPRDGPGRPSPDGRPVTDHNDSPVAASLWDRAYDALKKDSPQLVEIYEKLLLEEAPKDGIPAGYGPEGMSRQAQLDAIIARGLQRKEEKKKQYNVAGYELVPGDLVAQGAQLVTAAKDFIGDAVQASPQASLAWAGVCLVLPLLTNPPKVDKDNREAFAYVAGRMRYYAAFEPLLQRLGQNPGVDAALVAEANTNIVALYQGVLELEIRSVLRFFQGSLGGYVKDVFLPKDWRQMQRDIEKLDAAVGGIVAQINDFAARQELESLSKTSAECREAMEQLLHLFKQQLLVAEDHRDIAEGHRDIAQEHRNIAERHYHFQVDEASQKCHQLLLLTAGTNGATYDWYKDRVENRVEGTCQWFLEHKYFKTWLKQDSGPLLVSAYPGCGKSVLAKHLIDKVLPHSATICYYFFKDKDQNTINQALCALLHQLFARCPALIRHAMPEYASRGENLRSSTSALWNILENAGRDPQTGPLVLVLDALDECAESDFRGLVQRLTHLFHADKRGCGKIKCLLTSRPYDSIVSEFHELVTVFPYIRIPGEDESEAISQEVNHVIVHRVAQLALPAEIKEYLTKRLLEVPHRTYLWVYLVFDYLREKRPAKTLKHYKAAIATLPESVNDAYDKILSKAREDQHPTVHKALSIILAATRPLTLAEMSIALAVDEEAQSVHDLELEEERDFGLRLGSWCGLFVSVHHGRIYFIHQTAREFLLATELPTPANAALPGPRWRHSITADRAHSILAKLCLLYLNLFNSSLNSSLGDQNAHAEASCTPDKRDFLDYSSSYWAVHFCETHVDKEGDGTVRLASEICNPTSKAYLTWIETGRNEIRQAPLVWAAAKGHAAVVHLLLENGADIEVKDEDGCTPLAFAAMMGHEATVQLLLENGADIEVKSKLGRTPLAWATRTGHEATVQLLLENGADIEVKDEDGSTPLALAAMMGREATVQLLLESGADIEVKDMEGLTPLAWAARMGREAIVRLLLESGADIEVKDMEGLTPLALAAMMGREATVQLLLESGADIEVQVMAGLTPLAWAARMGYEAIVQLLLENGADKEVKDVGGLTPLALATKRGHEVIVQLLLEHGAILEAEDKMAERR